MVSTAIIQTEHKNTKYEIEYQILTWYYVGVIIRSPGLTIIKGK